MSDPDQTRQVVTNGFDGTAISSVPSSLAGGESFAVDTASDEALLETIESNAPAILLLADEPPKRDGLAQFRRVRANDVGLPVILVGGDVPADRVESALSAGVTDYVTGTSPDQIGELGARIRAYACRPPLDGAVQASRWNDIVGSLAHDAKNPLNVVTGRLELLDIDEPHGSAINRSVGRVESLLNELSTIASVTDAICDREPVSVAEVAERTWTGDSEALTITTERTIEADPDAFEILLERLFENARQHGGEDISVTVGDSESGFYIADDGPGIPPSECKRVFEQGYGTDRDGEGYGLFVADSVARAHGWTLTAGESDDGGARLDITGC